MLKINGYTNDLLLSVNEIGQVYAGRRDGDQLPVILYVCPPGDSARESKLQQLYGLISKLRFKGVVGTLALFRSDRSLVMVLKRFNGEPLKSFLREQFLDVPAILDIASALAITLSRIHANRIIHGALQPRNILIKTDTREVVITGFEGAFPAYRERKLNPKQELVTEDLPYISPEQTGRMSREMDFRSDLYSLGITIYEMLVGRPPFMAEPMELIHLHLAGSILSPTEASSLEIPKLLSDIVMKLLEKDPDQRYQTARGLFADLEKLKKGEDNFPLGTEEIPDTLLLPTGLYGRSYELGVMHRVFQRVEDGHAEMITLTGQPGVGKTSVVLSFRKGIKRNTFFVRGKYDRLHQSTPYSGMIEAFSSWVDQVLTSSDETLKAWKQRLNKAMGHIGKVIIDLLPTLKWIMGDQPALPRLGPNESQNRIRLALTRFLMAVAEPKQPMVLFLDDVQWADTASLSLIENILTVPDKPALLIIASYRPGELTTGHVFSEMLARLARNQRKPQSIHVKPWTDDEANAYIADTLSRNPGETRELAELVRRKTGNNPLFVRQFLLHSYNLGLIYFTPGNGWFWNAEAIEREGIPDDLVSMMMEKITQLPETTRKVLELAGSIGNGFNPEIILAVSDLDEDIVALGLYNLTLEGLVAPAGSVFHFTHDRIYEAASAMQSESQRAQVHLALGRKLLEDTDQNSLPEKVFTITKHLNLCLNIIDSPKEQRKIAELNLIAGEKSLEAAAYSSATEHFKAGLSLSGEATWEQDYNLLFQLHLGSAESRYMAGNIDEAQAQFDMLMQHKLNMVDLARVAALQVSMFCSVGDMDKAIAVGLQGMERLGMPIPAAPARHQLLHSFIAVQISLGRKGPNRLKHLHHCTDERMLACMHLLSEMIVPCFFNNSRLAAYLTFYTTRLVCKHGHHPRSPLVFAFLGAMIGIAWGDNQGNEYGQFALWLLEKSAEDNIAPRVRFVVTSFIDPWLKNCAESAQDLQENVDLAREVGDLQFAIFSKLERLNLLVSSGEHVSLIQKDAKSCEEATRVLGYKSFGKVATRISWFAAFLRGDNDNLPHGATSDPFQLDRLKSEKLKGLLYYVGPFAVTALFYLGRFEEAYELARRFRRKLKKVLPFSRQRVDNDFYLGLCCAQLYGSASPQRKKRILKHLKISLKLFATWSARGPANHQTQFLILQAEMARLGKDAREAWFLYTAADDHARTEGLVHLSALIHEHMGSFALEQDWKSEASYHLGAAINDYHKWGAEAKVEQIRTFYSSHIAETEQGELVPESTDDQRKVLEGSLDLSTVVSSALAISQEMELERVLERVMTSAIENAGAQRGLLLLKSDDRLWLEAEGSVNGGFLRIPQMDPVDSSDQLPMSIVRYVQRTSETVVLGNAHTEGLFREDPYIMEVHSRSVLLMPILTQSKFVGVLYLENNLVSNAFTKERTEVLHVIAAQGAIALENARLYDELSLLNRNLEKRVEDRTAELRDANLQLTVEVEERIKAEKDLMDLQSKLVETARRAGMTEVAIGVLHNVGNVLNSVTISTTCLAESQKNSRIPQLDRLVELLNKNKDNLGQYLTEDPRGKLFPAYLEKLAGLLNKQRAKDTEEIKKLSQHLSHAIEVIRAQQAQANVKAVLEPVTPSELMDQAEKVNATDIKKCKIAVEHKYEPIPVLLIDKHKVLQILINLVKNAGQSIAARGNENGCITLEVRRNRDGSTAFQVTDNGVGISGEHLSRVFSYGFTTKPDGNGYGLHNAANSATEMGGNLTVQSEGMNRGASFLLSLPLEENRVN